MRRPEESRPPEALTDSDGRETASSPDPITPKERSVSTPSAGVFEPTDTRRAKIRLIRRIRRFDQVHLLEALVVKLRTVESTFPWINNDGSRGEQPELFWLPWELLLLIETTICFGRRDPVGRAPSDQHLQDLLLGVRKLGFPLPSKVSEPGEHKIPRFLRIIAHQQFWWQSKLMWYDFARVLAIFSSGPAGTRCSAAFQRIYGSDINSFLQVALAAWLGLEIIQGGKGPLPHLNELNLTSDSQAAFDRFFCAGLPRLAQTIKNERNAENNQEPAIATESPLRFAPILYLHGLRVPVSNRLFGATIETGIYDRLKTDLGPSFCTDFGRAFEEYFHQSFRNAGLTPLPEARLRALIGQGKAVDAALISGRATILFEAKGAELKASARLRPHTENMQRALENSVIKGVTQAYETARRLNEQPQISLPRDYYVIIVTYKEMFLGPGSGIWSEFLREPVTRRLAPAIPEAIIDPERIFIASAGDFDELLGHEHQQPGFMGEFLPRCADRNRKLETRLLTLGQHFRAEKLGFPPLVNLEPHWNQIKKISD